VGRWWERGEERKREVGERRGKEELVD